MQKIRVRGQSVRTIKWKQTDRRTDGRTEAIALPPVITRSVNKDNHKPIGLLIRTNCRLTGRDTPDTSTRY